jgi:nucleotide-binding universal stress UspA family protein
MHSLLVATDLTDRSKHVFYRTVQLARQFHAQLTVLYVIEKELPDEMYDGLNVDEDYQRAQQREHKQEIQGLLHDEFRQVMPQLAGQPLNVHPVFEEGEPVEVILGACARLKPDLLVVGAHGITGRFLLGSVSTTLLREPATDMLVVRA